MVIHVPEDVRAHVPKHVPVTVYLHVQVPALGVDLIAAQDVQMHVLHPVDLGVPYHVVKNAQEHAQDHVPGVLAVVLMYVLHPVDLGVPYHVVKNAQEHAQGHV